jgi:hypothetical protein
LKGMCGSLISINDGIVGSSHKQPRCLAGT